MADLVPVRRALVSVSDKAGLVEFCRGLSALGVEIISTGGTASALRGAGLPVTSIDEVTGFPEILDGRVKTLHPKVHGGLLGRRDDPSHAEQMRTHDIHPIDLVCVNLYPFEQTIAKPNATRDEAIENIDIGGPSMIRSAAKNHAHVAVVTGPAQYSRVMDEMRANAGATTLGLRESLAAEAFAQTARYDAAIAAYMAKGSPALFPPLLSLACVRVEELRYGENPHQGAALYRMAHRAGPSVAWGEQLHGKELSYNNLNDAAAALDLVVAIARARPGPVAAAVIKHTNPCGAASAPTMVEAVDAAIDGDPVAAFGGILSVSATLDEATALRLIERKLFLEVIVAPRFSVAAIDLLRAKWVNLRLLAVGDFDAAPAGVEWRTISGGLLAQERDTRLATPAEFVHRAGPAPTPAMLAAAAFLEPVCRALFSNAIAIGGGSGENGVRLYGAGAGQMDRVTACGLAVGKAGDLAKGGVAFSDAFFPFDDGPTLLVDSGVVCIVHPGGSKRDQDTFDLCEKRGVTCLTTGLRHFRH